jgi:hypothetical protein
LGFHCNSWCYASVKRRWTLWVGLPVKTNTSDEKRIYTVVKIIVKNSQTLETQCDWQQEGWTKELLVMLWYVLVDDKCEKSSVHFWLWKPETLQLATWILVNCSKGYCIWNLGCARAPFIQHCAQSFILFHILLITSAKHLTVTNQLQWLTHKTKIRKKVENRIDQSDHLVIDCTNS